MVGEDEKKSESRQREVCNWARMRKKVPLAQRETKNWALALVNSATAQFHKLDIKLSIIRNIPLLLFQWYLSQGDVFLFQMSL